MRRDGSGRVIVAPLAPPSPIRRGVGGEVSRTPYVRDARAVAAGRQFRKQMTDAERLLWAKLRRDQLGTRFRRQHPIGRHVVDFFAPEVKLALELDGGQHANQETGDATRTRKLLDDGVVVLRFWNHEVIENMEGVLTAIAAVIGHLRKPPSPLTPLRNGGGEAAPDLRALNLRLSLPESPA